MENLRGLLGIRRMDKVPNAWIKELCRVMKRVDERIDGVLWWFNHVERIQNDRIVKRVYVEECAGRCLMDRLQKRCIDTVKDSLRKRGLDVRQTKRVQDRSEWHGFVRGNAWGVGPGEEGCADEA